MVNFKKLADQAKSVVDKRGGVNALKADAEQLRGIAKGGGSLTDKAKAAAEALKQSGESTTGSSEAPAGSSQAPIRSDEGASGTGPQDPEALGSSQPADKPSREHRGERDRERHHGKRDGAHRGQGGRGEGGDPSPDA